MRLPDPIRRALRTFIQSWSGTFLGLWALSGISPETFAGIGDMTIIGKMAIAAAVGTIPAMVAYIQNALEDKVGRAFLISKVMPSPSPTQPPAEGNTAAELVTASEDIEVSKPAKKVSKTAKKTAPRRANG